MKTSKKIIISTPRIFGQHWFGRWAWLAHSIFILGEHSKLIDGIWEEILYVVAGISDDILRDVNPSLCCVTASFNVVANDGSTTLLLRRFPGEFEIVRVHITDNGRFRCGWQSCIITVVWIIPIIIGMTKVLCLNDIIFI